MKIQLLTIGKTEEKYLNSGIDLYLKRLKHYISFKITEIPDLKNTKNLSQEQQKQKEAELLLKHIKPTDYVCLLDERGKSLSSPELAQWINKLMVQSTSQLILVIGGPYGFHATIYERANMQLSLSAMTFSHQMIRLFVVEQIYRAFTILKGEPYHHA